MRYRGYKWFQSSSTPEQHRINRFHREEYRKDRERKKREVDYKAVGRPKRPKRRNLF